MPDPSSDHTLRADFLKALADDFAAHGVAAIVAYREEKPADYLKIIASVLPKDAGDAPARNSPPGMSDDELLARIRLLDAAISAANNGDTAAQAPGLPPFICSQP
jgi:hypothetical protein